MQSQAAGGAGVWRAAPEGAGDRQCPHPTPLQPLRAPAPGADPARPPSRPEFQPRARGPGGPRVPGGAGHSQVNEHHGGAGGGPVRLPPAGSAAAARSALSAAAARAPTWPHTLRALASRGFRSDPSAPRSAAFHKRSGAPGPATRPSPHLSD